MKFLLLAALVSVAVALPHSGLVVPGAAGPAPVIIDEFEPIAIGPAIINEFEPVAVGPAIVEDEETISFEPEIIDFPVPNPVIDNPAAPASAPLVQIILNINQAGTGPVFPAPVVVPEIKPEPVQVVEIAPEPVEIEPIQVIETAPVPVEPVIIGTPILPVPVVILPEELN